MADERAAALVPAAPGPWTAVYAVVAALALAVHALHTAAGVGGGLLGNWLYVGLYVLAAAGCAYGAVRGDARPAWRFAFVGVLVWGGAEAVYRLSEPDPRAWYPPVSQAMLFVGFALAYTTLGLLARARVRRFAPVLALDGLIAGLTSAAVAALVLFAPHATAGAEREPGELPVVFLIGALVGLAFVVTVVGLTGWRPGAAWGLLALAIVVNTVGDAVVVGLAADDEWRRGAVTDTLFAASALLLGLAALFGARTPGRARAAPRMPVVPLACALVALGILVAATGGAVAGAAIGLAAAALAVTVARMAVALELLARSRRQALRDDLTGLGNRRRLINDLSERAEAGAGAVPFTLVLFDLDGFKRYNDLFGHVSGDALLERLGERLGAAVGPGDAYRMGGDEFCVMVDGTGAGAAAPVVDAVAALQEQGEGFSVTTSFGVVEIPEEADDVRSALTLADQRMYAHKARGRGDARSRQAREALLQTLSEREPALRDHVADVAALATGVARRLGLDDAVEEEIGHAAELHDVGKMAIPDAILHKPGPLSPDEVRFMRQHTLIGERILNAAPALSSLAPLVRSSHERWDGAGYPDGLAGDAIPIGARIIAVCDAYQAMRSRRPYSEPRSRESALAELSAGAGGQFDVAVVDAFVAEVEAAPE